MDELSDLRVTKEDCLRGVIYVLFLLAVFSTEALRYIIRLANHFLSLRLVERWILLNCDAYCATEHCGSEREVPSYIWWTLENASACTTFKWTW